MEEIVNGIVIKSVDYGDNDKILTIYSLEKGKFTAKAKGVKKATAKLKFISDPLCFSEFVITSKANSKVVINASYIENFYDIRLDIKKYYLANTILELINECVEEGVSNKNLFDIIINGIKGINYYNPIIEFIKTILNLTKEFGYRIDNFYCDKCGEDIQKKVYFNADNGCFYCNECKGLFDREIRIETYRTLKDIVEEKEVDEESCIYVIKFLLFYLTNKLEIQNDFVDLFSILK